MTCREVADFIAGYLDRTLPDETIARFERHLTGCDNCVEYLAGYRATVALARRAFDDRDLSVPATVPEELVRAILNSR